MGLKRWTRVGPIAFATVGQTSVLSPTDSGSFQDALHVRSVEVGNSSGANASVGFGLKLPNAMWKAGTFAAANSVYVDDTTDAQDAGTDDFLMGGNVANNDGFLIQSFDKFNVVNFKINTVGSGGGIATPTYSYWNGTAWTTFTPIVTADYTSSTAQCFAFLTPSDWAVLATGDAPVTGGADAGKYAIKVTWGTKSTTAPIADYLLLVKLIDYVENCADGASEILEVSDLRIPYHASLVPFCSTANAANWVSIEYRQGA